MGSPLKLAVRGVLGFMGAALGATAACSAPYAVPYTRANLASPAHISDGAPLQPLKSAASLRGRRFGAAVATKYLEDDSSFRNLVLRECRYPSFRNGR